MNRNEIITEQELEKIGLRMRQLRKAKGFRSAEKFAFQHDLDRAQYGRYEKGLKDMRLSSFIKVLNALGTDWLGFFGEGFENFKELESDKK